MKKELVLIGIFFIIAIGIYILSKSLKPSGHTLSKTPKPTLTNAAMISPTGIYNIVTEKPAYYAETKGFLAKPAKEGSYPGIVMMHEWWGLNDNIEEMAKKLASQGYIVLAVDLYHGKVAKTPQEAGEYVSSFDHEDGIKNMDAAVDYLKQEKATKIGSLGWCFGGGQSLALALSGEKLDATVLYYGTPLVTDTNELSKISWPVLGIFGDKDQAISNEQQAAFKKGLADANVTNEVYIYPGLSHAFANPSSKTYAPSQTKDAWSKTLTFLAKYLKS